MKKVMFTLLLAGGLFGFTACNSETGTVREAPEGYGEEQRDPGDTGNGGVVNDELEDVSGDGQTGSDANQTLTDTTGTSATMQTKTGAGTSQNRGETNTSKSETTKNVEVQK